MLLELVEDLKNLLLLVHWTMLHFNIFQRAPERFHRPLVHSTIRFSQNKINI